MNIKKQIATLLAAACVSPLATHAATITTATGAGADTFVRGGGSATGTTSTDYQNQNYGADAVLQAKATTDLQFTRKTYLRFDLTSLSANTITAGSLTLIADKAYNVDVLGPTYTGSVTFNLYGVTDSATTGNGAESFTEGTGTIAVPVFPTGIDFSNSQSATSNNTTSNTSNGTLLTTLTYNENGTSAPEISIGDALTFSSASLVTFLEAQRVSTNNKFAVFILTVGTIANSSTGLGNDILSITSKETTSARAIPTLEITQVPEPTTLAMVLGGIGMLVGFQRARRRAQS